MTYRNVEKGSTEYKEVMRCAKLIDECLRLNNIKVNYALASLHLVLTICHKEAFKDNFKVYKETMMKYIEHAKDTWNLENEIDNSVEGN